MNTQTNVPTKKSIRSPEELDAAIRISTPGVWSVVLLSLLVLVAFLLWGCLGSIPVQMNVMAWVSEGKGVMYIRAEEMQGVDKTRQVLVDGSYHNITAISEEPISIEEVKKTLSDEAFYRLNLDSAGYEVRFDANGVTDGGKAAGVVTEEIHPISFVLKSKE